MMLFTLLIMFWGVCMMLFTLLIMLFMGWLNCCRPCWKPLLSPIPC